MARILLALTFMLAAPPVLAVPPQPPSPAAEGTFPHVPASTVALLRLSDLNTTYAKVMHLLNNTNVGLPPTLKDALVALPNFQTLDLNQQFLAAFLLHASNNLSAPFVPGFLAAPHPALLLLLPGVSMLHLAQLPGLEAAQDGSPFHYRLQDFELCKVTLGAYGPTGVMILGLQYYDLSTPPTTSLRLPKGAVATMSASAASLALDYTQLEVLLQPVLLAGPSLLTLLETTLGAVLEFGPGVKAGLARWGLTPSILGTLSSLVNELFELALTLMKDTRAVVLSAAVQGASHLHLGQHTCYKSGSYMSKLSLAPVTTASLWPDLPASDSLMLAAGNHLSPATVAEFEQHFFAPALAHLQQATQGMSISPAAALLRDAITLLRDLNGPIDGAQLALLNNGGLGEAQHPNSPPGLSAGTRTALMPGMVALFSKGNTVADAWKRHNTLLSLLRTAAGPGTPWARTTSQELSEDVKFYLDHEYLGASSLSLVLPSAEVELVERFMPAVKLSTFNHSRTIGGVVFECRRITLTGVDTGHQVVVDTAVGMVGARVMAFGGLSDEAVLPFVQAALRPAAAAAGGKNATPPLLAALPEVNATFSRLPRSRASTVAVRPAAWVRYYLGLSDRTPGRQEERLIAQLEEERATVGVTLSPAAEGGAVPAGIELVMDLGPIFRAVKAADELY